MATGIWFVRVCLWRRIWSGNGGAATFEALGIPRRRTTVGRCSEAVAVPQRRCTVRPRNSAAAALNFKIELGIG